MLFLLAIHRVERERERYKNNNRSSANRPTIVDSHHRHHHHIQIIIDHPLGFGHHIAGESLHFCQLSLHFHPSYFFYRVRIFVFPLASIPLVAIQLSRPVAWLASLRCSLPSIRSPGGWCRSVSLSYYCATCPTCAQNADAANEIMGRPNQLDNNHANWLPWWPMRLPATILPVKPKSWRQIAS